MNAKIGSMYRNHKNPFRGSKKKQAQDSDMMIPGRTPCGWMDGEGEKLKKLDPGRGAWWSKEKIPFLIKSRNKCRKKKYRGDIKELKLNRNKLQPQPWGLCEESEQTVHPHLKHSGRHSHYWGLLGRPQYPWSGVQWCALPKHSELRITRKQNSNVFNLYFKITTIINYYPLCEIPHSKGYLIQLVFQFLWPAPFEGLIWSHSHWHLKPLV